MKNSQKTMNFVSSFRHSSKFIIKDSTENSCPVSFFWSTFPSRFVEIRSVGVPVLFTGRRSWSKKGNATFRGNIFLFILNFFIRGTTLCFCQYMSKGTTFGLKLTKPKVVWKIQKTRNFHFLFFIFEKLFHL